MDLDQAVGVVPYAVGADSPADRRRLGCWSRSRGHHLDIQTPQLRDVVVVNPLSDHRAWLDWRRGSRHRRLILDVVDFRYLRDALEPGMGPSTILRDSGRSWLYGSGRSRLPWPRFSTSLREILLRADTVTCSSPEHASYLATFDISGRHIIDCHEEIPLLEPRPVRELGALRILWEGQLATLTFVNEMRPGLQVLATHRPVELNLCTDPEGFKYANRFGRVTPMSLLEPLRGISGLTLSVTPWSPAALATVATRVDAAVLPVTRDDPTSWLKAENRALIMWRLGLPVLMSATPAYKRVAEAAGVAGLAESPSDWGPLLAGLTDDSWRINQAARGHQYVCEHHDPEGVHREWDRVFQDL